MKKYYFLTLIICLGFLLGFSFHYHLWDRKADSQVLRVGFLSENDEMNSNTYNFFQVQTALKKNFPDQVELFTLTNIRDDETEDALEDLINSGCRIIFTNTHSDRVKYTAAHNPDVQFCQMSTAVAAEIQAGSNYHTFNAKYFQAHYVSGIAAGMKLRELIDGGIITPDQAVIGYVASMPTAEVISGFTAFILGALAEAPEAVMRVQYVNELTNFSREKAISQALINEGCVIIAQNSGTTGPAAACQEASANRTIFHIGYNDNLINDASAFSMIVTHANWEPYVTGAVRAVMNDKPIEEIVAGELHGNDIAAGFDQNWLEILDMNENVAAPGTMERVQQAIDDIKNNKVEIFKGNYIGVDPNNMRIKIDLNEGFKENGSSSKPTFHYILRNVITVEKTVDGQ